MLSRHFEITDKSKPTPFECYLVLDTDNGHSVEAYEIKSDSVLDVEKLTRWIYPDCEISFEQSMAGPNNAYIITDGRNPDSVVVWESRDFYFE